MSRSSSGAARARVPLRLKLATLAASLATIPLAVVGLRLIDVNATAVELLSRELQLAVVDDVSREVDRELAHAQDTLNSVGRVLTSDELLGDQMVAVALAQVEAAEVIDHAGIYDASGELIDVIREDEASPVELPEQLPEPWRDEARRRHTATGPARPTDGAPRVPLVVPLRAGGEVTGYAVSLVSLAPIQQLVERLATERFHDDSDSLYLVDERLRVLAHPRRERAAALASAADEPILDSSAALLLEGTLARSGEFTSADGRQMLASTTTVPGRPWAVIAQVPQSRAYASLNTMRRVVLETVAVAIILALVLGLVVAGRITSPLRRLTRYAAELAARRFETRVEVHTRDELALLASAMSGAAADLEQSEQELRRELAIRADLGRFLPADLVDQIVAREREVALGGERRQVTVLFADVVAFTPLVEDHAPEEVVALLNELFTILTEIVFRHEGMVDKFIGDCVMALWGAPGDQSDQAERAQSAAEDMMRWLETGNVGWQQRFDVTLRLAIGVHTGEAVVGNIGSETRMEYTAIGDAVNVAARLEAIARPGQVLVSEATREAAGDGFDYLEAGTQKLAGRAGSIHLYELRL